MALNIIFYIYILQLFPLKASKMKWLVCINEPIETLHNSLLDLVRSSIRILVYFDLEDKITYKSIGIISDNVGINFILGELVTNESGIKILGFYFSDITTEQEPLLSYGL